MERTLQKIVAYIIAVAEPEQIFLFGSFAEGKQNVHSDLDLLIVTKHDEAGDYIAERVEVFIREFGLQSDVLVRSEEEFQRAVSESNSFLSSVAKNAKKLYKKEEIFFS